MSTKLPDIDSLVDVLDNMERQGQTSVLAQAGRAYIELLCAMGGILQLKHRLGPELYSQLCAGASKAKNPTADQLRVIEYTNTVGRHITNGAGL